MTPQELKNSILQLAVEGKLVPQNPADGNVKDLYALGIRERTERIQKGVAQKERNIPEITGNDIPFELPENWMWIRLGEILDIARGGSPRPIKAYLTDSPDGLNWIKIGDSDIGGKYINSTKEKIIKEGLVKTRFVYAGDFLLTNSMSFGRPYILNVDGCIHDGWLVLNNYQSCYDKDFLYYLLSSNLVFNQFQDLVSGAVVKNLNSDKVAIILVPLPPLAEQKRIVAKIEELLPYIDRYTQAYEKLESFNKAFPQDMQKSILQQAVEGKLVPQNPADGNANDLLAKIRKEKAKLIKEGKIKEEKPLPEITEDEKPFDIPDSWCWVRWGDLSESIQYGYNAPAKENGRIKMLRISDIQNGEVIWNTVPYCDISEEEIPVYQLMKNDILFARTGGTVGKSFLVKEVPEDAIYAGYLIRTRYSDSLSPEYLKFFMESQLYWTQLHNGTIATAQPNCNGQTLSKMILPLPPLAEQESIVAKIEELLPLCKKLEE